MKKWHWHALKQYMFVKNFPVWWRYMLVYRALLQNIPASCRARVADIPWRNWHSRSKASNWWLSMILTHVLKGLEAVSGNSNTLICCWWFSVSVQYGFLWKALGLRIIRPYSLTSHHSPGFIHWSSTLQPPKFQGHTSRSFRHVAGGISR